MKSDSQPEKPLFTEDSIRPDALMIEADRLHDEDNAWLWARREQFVNVDCPSCAGTNTRPHWVKDGFTYVQCAQCDTVFLNPRPGPTLLDEHYRTAQSYAFWSAKIFPASEPIRRDRIAKPRVEGVIDICKRYQGGRGGVLVEVGAGHGTFCVVARDTGFFDRVVAIDPAPSNAASCRARGLEVIEAPIEQVALDGASTDVVVSFEVIEHLFDPKQFLDACIKTLRPGGLLVLSCPNLKGFEVAALGTASRTVDPEHLSYFHPASLSALLKRCGLEVLELRTPGELDAEIVRKRAMTGFADFSGQPFMRTLLFEEWERVGANFQRFLSQNLLSAHMWAVARKAG